MKTKRFGVSMEDELLEKLNRIVEQKRYPNRSEAIRDLIRSSLVEEEWKRTEEETIGVLVIVFDHHQRELSSRLLEKEHMRSGEILATLHLHLDHHNCLEAKVIRGIPAQVQALADELIAMKGVKFGRLIPATIGKNLR
ncbi:MAG: nickel-responsive transcriptional regulator NikR [bacterium]|nr:MAG: nickel-responsive transcriptional regulator NikR [bacterium]